MISTLQVSCCSDTGLFCGDAGLCCWDTGLFCGDGHACRSPALYPHIGLFSRNIQLITQTHTNIRTNYTHVCITKVYIQHKHTDSVKDTNTGKDPGTDSDSSTPKKRKTYKHTHTHLHTHPHLHPQPRTHSHTHMHMHMHTRTLTHTLTQTHMWRGNTYLRSASAGVCVLWAPPLRVHVYSRLC